MRGIERNLHIFKSQIIPSTTLNTPPPMYEGNGVLFSSIMYRKRILEGEGGSIIVHIILNTGVASITVNGTRYTSSTDIKVNPGTTLNWSATASGGYYLYTSSGTIQVGEVEVYISPTTYQKVSVNFLLDTSSVSSVTIDSNSIYTTITGDSTFTFNSGEYISWTAIATSGYGWFNSDSYGYSKTTGSGSLYAPSSGSSSQYIYATKQQYNTFTTLSDLRPYRSSNYRLILQGGISGVKGNTRSTCTISYTISVSCAGTGYTNTVNSTDNLSWNANGSSATVQIGCNLYDSSSSDGPYSFGKNPGTCTYTYSYTITQSTGGGIGLSNSGSGTA